MTHPSSSPDGAPDRAADPVEHLRSLCTALLMGLVERDLAIRLALLAALAGEHLLLVGPPGTAKSLVARRLRLAFAGSTYFERLLTRFTAPEELFGPLSIKGLEEDRYERLTAGYLPTASVAFLDEIFKANSAILNALLTLLNEREFDNGSTRTRTPLVAVIGASNELVEGEELDALCDRFLLRLHVGPVSKEAFPRLLGLRGEVPPEVPPALRMTADDLATVGRCAERVELPEDVVALLRDLREWCAAEGLRVSDRRWRKVVKLLQVSAVTNGRARVSVWDCWLLQHCLWDTPEQRAKVYEWYASRVGTSAAMDPSRLTRILVAWEGKLKSDQDSRSQMRDPQGRPLFKGLDGTPTPDAKGRTQRLRGTEPLFLAPVGSHQQDGNSYHSSRPIADRTSGGTGFTAADLDALLVDDGNCRFRNWTDRATYLVEPSNWLMVDREFPAFMEPTRHKAVYVDNCLRELDALKVEITQYRAHLSEHLQSMEAEIRTHLWVTTDFVEPAGQALQQTRREVETLLARVEHVHKGFELLPREGVDERARAAVPAVVPKPAPSASGGKRPGAR